MAMVIAKSDAPVVPRLNAAARGTKHSFFNFPDQPDLPHASLNGHLGNRIGAAHFHIRDQFQVLVDGKFKIGRHELSPYCVHFARAYTPYGPLIPMDATGDYTFVVMRARRDNGPQYLSKERAQLESVPNRKPWQISCAVNFPAPETRDRSKDVLLQPIPGMQDEEGLAGYTWILKPNVKATAPDLAHGDGQYLVVVKGSLWHDNKEHKALALVFVARDEGAYQIHAGADGLEAIVLNFPQVERSEARVNVPAVAAGLKKWQCALCAFSYDEALGMPDEGVPPGTRWEDVPETWSCPDCSASKSDFQMIEV